MNEQQIRKLLAPLKRGLGLMVGRAIVNLVNDAGGLQLLQVDRLAGETADGLERFGEYGLASHPPKDSEALVVSVGGVRSHGVIIAVENRQYRLRALASGEAALYDDLGQTVYLKRDGIRVESPLKVDIAAPAVKVTATTATVDSDTTTVTGDATVQGNATVEGDVLFKGQGKFGAAAAKFVMLADMTPSTRLKSL